MVGVRLLIRSGTVDIETITRRSSGRCVLAKVSWMNWACRRRFLAKRTSSPSPATTKTAEIARITGDIKIDIARPGNFFKMADAIQNPALSNFSVTSSLFHDDLPGDAAQPPVRRLRTERSAQRTHRPRSIAEAEKIPSQLWMYISRRDIEHKIGSPSHGNITESVLASASCRKPRTKHE